MSRVIAIAVRQAPDPGARAYARAELPDGRMVTVSSARGVWQAAERLATKLCGKRQYRLLKLEDEGVTGGPLNESRFLAHSEMKEETA